MAVSISDLTSNVETSSEYIVTGDGVFDKLMATVNTHLEAQFQLGRITGTEYATVYLGALQATVQQSVAFLLGQDRANAEASLLAQKEITEFAQTNQTTKVAPASDSIMGSQVTVQQEQAKGFLWNAKQKYLKTLTDMWSVNVSTAGVASTEITAINAVGAGNLNTQIANAEPS